MRFSRNQAENKALAKAPPYYLTPVALPALPPVGKDGRVFGPLAGYFNTLI